VDTATAAAVDRAFLLERVEWLVEKAAVLAVSVARLVDAVASELAFASASRDFDGWPLERDHKLGSEHLYTDDNGSRRSGSSRNGGQDTSGLCIPRYASINASYRRSEVSPHNDHLRDDTSLHASTATDAVVDGARPAGDQTLDDFDLQQRHYSHSVGEEALGPEALVARHPVAAPAELVGSVLAPAVLPAAVVAVAVAVIAP
jgi:hypothetical protein